MVVIGPLMDYAFVGSFVTSWPLLISNDDIGIASVFLCASCILAVLVNYSQVRVVTSLRYPPF